jgi:predicted SprT family Zn-dependent metalloprotease
VGSIASILEKDCSCDQQVIDVYWGYVQLLKGVNVDDKLLIAIGKAEQRFIDCADDLKVSKESIKEWLSKVVHIPNGSYRKVNICARAYYSRQQIRYNQHYRKIATDDDLLDTVLHELGHLFTWNFFQDAGHSKLWKATGLIVGYAPFPFQTKNHSSYAAYGCPVSVPQRLLSTIVITEAPNVSRANKPVQLVHQICEAFPYASRAEVIDICVSRGVNRNTASTQYSKWKYAR